MGRLVMAQLEPPIFVVEGLDISVHDTVESAERSLEPWWVNEECGSVFDASGRLIQLKAGKHRVRIESWEEVPAHADELRSFLSDYLKLKGHPREQSANAELSDLVARLEHDQA
jgi:hypothetical protein